MVIMDDSDESKQTKYFTKPSKESEQLKFESFTLATSEDKVIEFLINRFLIRFDEQMNIGRLCSSVNVMYIW